MLRGGFDYIEVMFKMGVCLLAIQSDSYKQSGMSEICRKIIQGQGSG